MHDKDQSCCCCCGGGGVVVVVKEAKFAIVFDQNDFKKGSKLKSGLHNDNFKNA